MILFNLDIDFNLIIEGSETTESLPFLQHIAKYFLETNLSISHWGKKRGVWLINELL